MKILSFYCQFVSIYYIVEAKQKSEQICVKKEKIKINITCEQNICLI